jgi:iron complex outermembrane receptor protein
MRINSRRLAFATLATAALVETTSPTLAVAQLVLEEVVVTARKREESLQETPVAVSAFSGPPLPT